MVLIAAVLRFVGLGQSPPGIHVDAAAAAWNAACLLERGTDWRGESWPVFYGRGFGENVPTLHYYALVPFQWVAGTSAASTALPSAVSGVLSVLLAFYVARRLFGEPAGLVAAAVLAVMPWHLFLSRWGHESGLSSFLTLAPIAGLLAARLPLTDAEESEPRPLLSFVAGLATGVCCYGHFAMRIFLPAFLGGIVLANPAAWLRVMRDHRGRRALLALALGLAVTAGPLLVAHLSQPEMAKRGQAMLLWDEDDSPGAKAGMIASRYPGHFGPDFLFATGDLFPLHSLPGSGPLPWYLLPLLVAGAATVLIESRGSAAARTLLAWLLVYPIGDLFARHESLHALRSAPGIGAFAVLAALGAVRAWGWFFRWNRVVALVTATVVALASLGYTGRFAYELLVRYPRSSAVRHLFNADLLEASAWVRPRLDEIDAVFFSTRASAALDQPFVVTLVGLRYEPAQWFRDEIDIDPRPDTDLYKRYGKVHFLFDREDIARVEALENNGREDDVLFVLRPGERLDLPETHVIRHPDGTSAYVIHRVRI